MTTTSRAKPKASAVLPPKQPFDLSSLMASAGLAVTENTRLTVVYFHPLLLIKSVTMPLNMEVCLRLKITPKGATPLVIEREERNEYIYQMLDEKMSRKQIQDLLGIKNTIIDSALATLQK